MITMALKSFMFVFLMILLVCFPDHAHSTSSLNVDSSNQTTTTSTRRGGGENNMARNVHGLLNAVSWGFMMPHGVLIARGGTPENYPSWFYMHVGTQFLAYIIGVAGWATGMRLGNQSHKIQHCAHRNIGIVLFCLGTLQAFAILLRPSPDHRFRKYWNVYHHATGYAVIILSIVNNIKGIEILQAEKMSKAVCIYFVSLPGVLAILGETCKLVSALRRMWADRARRSATVATVVDELELH